MFAVVQMPRLHCRSICLHNLMSPMKGPASMRPTAMKQVSMQPMKLPPVQLKLVLTKRHVHVLHYCWLHHDAFDMLEW